MALEEIHWTDAVKLASPYPYALLVSMNEEEKPNIMGVGWWSFVSWQPPMLIVSIGFPRYTMECLENHDEFTLCFPSSRQSKGAWVCGKKSGRQVDKIPETGFKMKSSKKVTPPIIDGCTAAFECRIKEKLDAGDHRIYLAEILLIHGDKANPSHIYTIGYSEMIGFGMNLKVEKNLEK
jgi:flavin reductase (DIM6/NTAB) family NADH-FMN oxidoreductase RutF